MLSQDLLLTTTLHCHPKGNKDSQHSDTNDDSLGLAEDVVVAAQRGQAERWILGSCRFPVSLLFHPLAPPPPNAQGDATHPSGLQYFLQLEALQFYKNQGETWPQIPPSSLLSPPCFSPLVPAVPTRGERKVEPPSMYHCGTRSPVTTFILWRGEGRMHGSQ